MAETEMANVGVPGVALGMFAAGEFRSKGLGVADALSGRPVESSTFFRLCSLSKPYTATLIMSLRQAGLVELDRPVSTYLPDLRLADPDALRILTLRHLLHHTGGFASELPTELEAYGEDDGALGRAVRDFGLLTQRAIPGSSYRYCNAGYWLLGAVAAAVTGQSYEDAMIRRVLHPLGLRKTTFFMTEEIRARLALAEGNATNGERPSTDATTESGVDGHFPAKSKGYQIPRVRWPSGGLIAPVEDALRFAAFHAGGIDGETVLGAAGRAEMRESLVPTDEANEFRGLSWLVWRSGARSVIGHSGRLPGYRTNFTLVPDLGFALATLTNSQFGIPVHQAIRDHALRRCLATP